VSSACSYSSRSFLACSSGPMSRDSRQLTGTVTARSGTPAQIDLFSDSAHEGNRPFLPPGASAVWLNGAAPESNRPSRGLHDRTGFEDPLGHQARPLRRERTERVPSYLSPSR